jgi:DNA polymerase-3 subunit alpha (Gram-positive type)
MPILIMGFIASACERLGRPFNLSSIDTLVLSQNLLPQLKKHSLDSAANYLGLPEFQHQQSLRRCNNRRSAAFCLFPET